VRRVVLVAVLLWLLPILAAIIWSADAQESTSMQAIPASLSPFALRLMAGTVPIGGFVPTGIGSEMSILLTGVHAGLVIVGLQIGGLLGRWKKLQRGIHTRCQAGSDNAPTH
jgi:hypothetical protein